MVGIDKNEVKPIFVYPNPVNDNLKVRVNASMIGSVYTMTDKTGRVLLTGKLTSEISNINVSSLSAGMYILIIGEHNRQVFKIVKK